MPLQINEDRSYLSHTDVLAFDKGVAYLGIHSLRLVVTGQPSAQVMEHIIDTIASQFVVYQYKDKSITFAKDDWDIFFWSNEDMSYVRLSPNTKRPMERQGKDMYATLNIISQLKVYNLSVTIQYKAEYDMGKVNDMAKQYAESVQGKFITVGTMGVGKLKEVVYFGEKRYAFFQKGAKTKGYLQEPINLVGMALRSI